MMWALAVAVSLSAAVEDKTLEDKSRLCKRTAVKCTKDDKGYCTDPVVSFALNYAERQPIICLKVTIGPLVTVVLPPNTIAGKLAYGIKTTLKEPKKTDDGRVLIWPRMPTIRMPIPTQKEKVAGKIGPTQAVLNTPNNVQIPLTDGITINIELRLEEPGFPSVRTLVLSFPEREQESKYIQERLSTRLIELAEEYNKKQESLHADALRLGRRWIAKAILQREDASGVREMGERTLVIVTTKKIRRFGDHILLSFEILNRSKQPGVFVVKSVTVLGDGKTDLGAEFTGSGDHQIAIPFDEKAKVMTMFPVGEGHKTYDLHVEEDGGLSRKIEVTGIEF